MLINLIECSSSGWLNEKIRNHYHGSTAVVSDVHKDGFDIYKDRSEIYKDSADIYEDV